MLTAKRPTTRRVCDVPGCRNIAKMYVRKKSGAYLALCGDCLNDIADIAAKSKEPEQKAEEKSENKTAETKPKKKKS